MRASIVMIDGNPAYPDLSMQWRAGGGDAADVHGREPRAAHGLPQGRPRPDAARPVEHPPARRGRLAAAGRGLRLGLRAARARRAAELRLAAGPTSAPGSSRAARCSRSSRARSRAAASGSTRPPSTPTATRSSASSGELVIRAPMPSMPVGFWDDPRTARATTRPTSRIYPGVWRHGDWILFTERGSCVITGRSDATLNRGGVRHGHGRVLRGRRGARRGARQPRRPPRGRRGRRRRAAAVRRAARGRRARRRAARPDRRDAPRTSSRRATCPTPSRRSPRSRAR